MGLMFPGSWTCNLFVKSSPDRKDPLPQKSTFPGGSGFSTIFEASEINVLGANSLTSGPIGTYEASQSPYWRCALRCAHIKCKDPLRKKSAPKNNVSGVTPLGVRNLGWRILKVDQNRPGQKFPGHIDHAESGSAAEIGGKSLGPKSEVIADTDYSMAEVAGTRPVTACSFTAGGPKYTWLVSKAAHGCAGP